VLRFEGIQARYGSLEVLRGIDLVVPEGKTVAMIGANGAGKTTLLRVAAGLLKPAGGRVFLNGRDITGDRAHARAGAGLCLVPDDRGIFPGLTVRENIAMFLGGRDTDRASDLAASRFPVLGDRLDQAAGTMSGGEQQILALTRAFVTRPSIVLADELSMGLAPVVVDRIFDALAELHHNGVSLLIVEQYVDRVLDIADWVYLLHKGEVVFVGRPVECRDAGLLDRYFGGAA
jgi:branched-chain amino acid transport system ATP-binding protein